MLSDLYLPDRRDPTAPLAPFETSGVGDAQLGRNVVDGFPCECGHSAMMGQTVPYVKDVVSRDFASVICEHRRMSEWLGEAEFNDALCTRIARLREERGWTQAQMAAAVGVPFERYKKYETRSPMPHYLLPRFAQQVDRSVEYLLTGKLAPQARRSAGTLVRTGTTG